MMMMSVSGLILGLINVAIVLAILVLVGAIIVWFGNLLGWPVPGMVQRLYLAVVALVGLYLIVALLFGIPTIHIIGHAAAAPLWLR
jgi:hypothetical protein